MGRIHQLPPELSVLIAAGEVVERPASVVKELVENAVDAGAKNITVEIGGGGVPYIRVSDDGCGMGPEDLKNAFLRHSTSKIATKEDLFQISTFGFRGEALASICAVSKIDVMSKEGERPMGLHLHLEGGAAGELQETGCPDGTTFVIRELFYNTPARMKFLKKDATEAGAVADVVEKLALSHPEIAVTFIKDGKQALGTAGDGNLKNTLFSLYGREIYDALLPVSYSYEGIKVEGFTAKPLTARINRNMQNLFVNGRYIRSKLFYAALDEAYRDSLLHKRFPAAFLNLTLDFNLVDINVHPSKLEAKFGNEKQVYNAIYFAVKSALDAERRPIDRPATPEGEKVQKLACDERVRAAAVEQPLVTSLVQPEKERKRGPSGIMEATVRMPGGKVKAGELPDEGMVRVPAEVLGKNIGENKGEKPAEQAEPVQPEKKEEEPGAEEQLDRPQARIVGELFLTYIVAERGDEVLLIDKHAAHERFLYESMKGSFKNQGSQLLLDPLLLTLTRGEMEQFRENREFLTSAGFAADEFGENTLLVREIPLYVKPEDAKLIVQQTLEELMAGRNEARAEKLERALYSMACKAAVKAGMHTTREEMEHFVLELLEHTNIKYCPHGRPVAITLSRSEIEKDFGRIV